MTRLFALVMLLLSMMANAEDSALIISKDEMVSVKAIEVIQLS